MKFEEYRESEQKAIKEVLDYQTEHDLLREYEADQDSTEESCEPSFQEYVGRRVDDDLMEIPNGKNPLVNPIYRFYFKQDVENLLKSLREARLEGYLAGIKSVRDDTKCSEKLHKKAKEIYEMAINAANKTNNG